MKVNEFQAWFEGFTECITGIPNKKQWERIKEKVAAIDGKPIVEREYINTYYPRYRDYWYPNYIHCSGVSQSLASAKPADNSGAWVMNGQNANMNVSHTSGKNFDSISAMYALGKTEALEFSAKS